MGAREDPFQCCPPRVSPPPPPTWAAPPEPRGWDGVGAAGVGAGRGTRPACPWGAVRLGEAAHCCGGKGAWRYMYSRPWCEGKSRGGRGEEGDLQDGGATTVLGRAGAGPPTGLGTGDGQSGELAAGKFSCSCSHAPWVGPVGSHQPRAATGDCRGEAGRAAGGWASASATKGATAWVVLQKRGGHGGTRS